jgi:hypothetical protein
LINQSEKGKTFLKSGSRGVFCGRRSDSLVILIRVTIETKITCVHIFDVHLTNEFTQII